MQTRIIASRLLIFVGTSLCVLGFCSAPIALLLGLFLSLSIGNYDARFTSLFVPWSLGIAIVALGAGTSLSSIQKAGFEGVFLTGGSILGTFLLGMILNRFMALENNLFWLVTSGTAICGGSAIAAVASVVSASSIEVAVSLGIVFVLNSVALVLFPVVGDALSLTQNQFGLWSAFAIHDTSSVVGACMQFGSRALEVGTTTKLVRALWIVPLSVILSFVVQGSSNFSWKGLAKRTWFIFGFVIVAFLTTFFPQYQNVSDLIALTGRRVLILTLMLIGLNLNRDSVAKIGGGPALFGLLLWLLVSCSTLVCVLFYKIS